MLSVDSYCALPADDPARLLELWQADAEQGDDQLELDLLSEEGIIAFHHDDWLLGCGPTGVDGNDVHCIPYLEHALLPKIDLLQYDMDELELEKSSPTSTKCTFYNYPPKRNMVGKAVFDESSPSQKRRKVSEDGEYIPSVKDLNLPCVSPDDKRDEVAKYLQQRLDELVQKFQSSYASVMESKQKLLQEV